MYSDYENRYRVRYHLPFCRDCNELCVTPMCTRQMYDEWQTRHADHTVVPGSELP